MYQTVVTSLAQGNGPVQVAMAPVTTRIGDSAVTVDGQAVEVQDSPVVQTGLTMLPPNPAHPIPAPIPHSTMVHI
ncbi:hypothetical protein AAES_60345 [Amazona aestiva]|uniref:Uncharacterized protein n=1 Tax=Amazona aestiva TaxID=12930 RepID=A0A0Q3MLG1_AMAAE|nr:hypothetical protein AAES_60348 [Amazona aestiva]KQK83368.1 hypothetical protein AAES_60345 [Amazona aestiva]